MAGIYIHIPFCKSRCIYCGFYSTLRHDLQQDYVDAVCHEWQLRQHEIAEPIHTIYIGGGTPSLLTAHQLQQILNNVIQPSVIEATMEVNPDDVTDNFVRQLATLPVNRISMGVQTFDNQRLQFLRRRHTAEQAVAAIARLRSVGIRNISVDLIYGFPNQTLKEWQQDVNMALSLGVEHLSAYNLTYEEDTPLMRQLQQGKIQEIDEETARQMYETLIDQLANAGYDHYEISNFAKPNYHSRHNSSYWQEVPYIGLGAAAHSYDKKSRQWNVANIEQYIDAIRHNTVPCEKELIADNTRYNDLITTALRTRNGLPLDKLNEKQRRYCLQEAQTFLADGLLRITNNKHLTITRKGLFVSDYIMSSLIDA